MAKKKYTPLDLNFIQAQYSPQQDSIRQTAAMIMANAGWSKPSQQTLKEIARINSQAKQKNRPTFLSGFFDLLSAPLYGAANALDESIAAHQSDNDDSVVEDGLKMLGGFFVGAPKGLAAGVRGGTSMLDALPGVDINDDWQSDPNNKTRFGDVNIRLATKMSTEDAMKPENLQKALANVRRERGEVPEWLAEPFYGNTNADTDEESLKNFIERVKLIGIGEDILGDPLNFATFGGKSAATGAKAITEGLDAARSMAPMHESIIKGLETRKTDLFNFSKKPSFQAGYAPPVQAIDEVNPGTIAPIKDAPFNLPKGRFGAPGEFKDLSNLRRRETGKRDALPVSRLKQKELVRDIAAQSVGNDPKWLYKVADTLRTRHPNVEWTKTEEFLQSADRAVKSKGGRHNPQKMAPVLAQRIAEDVSAAKQAPQIERRLANVGDEISKVGVKDGKIVRGVEMTPKMKRSEAILVNKVVGKFEKEILHTGRAPGTGEGLARAIASGDNVRYSGPQQARMWNQITSSLKYADTRKFDKAVRVLRGVEDYFKSKGAIPHSGTKTADSVPLSLSDVVETLGPQFIGKSHAFITGLLRGDPRSLSQLSEEQLRALQALRAADAEAIAPAVQSGLTAAKNAAELIAKAPMSVGRKAENVGQVTKALREFTAAQGGGDVGSRIAGEYLGNLLGKSDVINAALNSNRLKTEAWLSKVGRPGVRHFLANEPDFVKGVTKAIQTAADLPSPAQLGKLVGPAARVKDWLGARFNAAYGVQDMRQTFLIEQASAMSTIARRANLINDLGRRFDPNDVDLWHEAFRTAQMNGIADGRVAELHKEISKAMENLFGGSGLRSGAIADSTVVGRNRLLLDELNQNLKRFGLSEFEFTAKKVKDSSGVTHDFSKGLDWMKSWEAWNVKKPYEFLHRVQNAIEHTVREKNMFDEIVTRFASPAKQGNIKYGVNHPRLAGFYFSAEGASQARTFVRMLEEVSTPNSKALQHFDHVLSKLKASLTIYIPGHHWTNLIGDTYYNWIAGVNKPIRYEQAVKTMLAQKGRYGDFASLEKLTGPKALEQAVARSLVKPDAGLAIPAAGNKTVITMQNGTKVTADMIYAAAMKQGILPSARVLEEVSSDVTSILDKWRPLGGRGQRGVHAISEIRDHIPRLAQFIDGIAKSKGSFAAATTSSARSVRKWHPDGLDLTKFERDVMKRVFPFYSWTRKAIPLAIESAIFASPKVMAYPRLMEAIAMSNGIDSGGQGQMPGDQMFPDWLRDRGIGPILGGPGNYSVINPSTPVLDTMSLMGHPGQGLMDMMNPMFKVPIETAQGQTLGRNVPIDDYPDYLAKQIPVVSQAGRASGQFGVSQSTKDEGFPNWTNILNMLTGAKMVDTGKYQKSAQFDLRDYLRKKVEQQGR